MTATGDQVANLASYGVFDWVVTDAEEQQILTLLRADPDLSATVRDLNGAGMLAAVLERVDNPPNRRDLLQLLGGGLDAAARGMVEPIIQDLDVNSGKSGSSALQYNLGRLGVTSAGAAFNRSAFSDLISSDATVGFTGSGATGVNPSQRGYIDWARAGLHVFDEHINPQSDLGAYLSGVGSVNRLRQAELLIRQPISTNFEESYASRIPSRLQVMRALADAHRLGPDVVAAIILAEQRDQTLIEDARDFLVGMMRRDTSIGLGQILARTASRNDLFSDLLFDNTTTMFAASTRRSNLSVEELVWLIASDEFNIAGVAKYVRKLADMGAAKAPADLPNTFAQFPGLDLAAYAGHSSSWPDDNVGALGMYYTSRPWTDNVGSWGWGWFVQQGYGDIRSAGVF
jgi:hypothetical protein